MDIRLDPNTDLHRELSSILAWLTQWMSQLNREKPTTLRYGHDSIGQIADLEKLRTLIEAHGLKLPRLPPVEKTQWAL